MEAEFGSEYDDDDVFVLGVLSSSSACSAHTFSRAAVQSLGPTFSDMISSVQMHKHSKATRFQGSKV